MLYLTLVHFELNECVSTFVLRLEVVECRVATHRWYADADYSVL